MKTVWEKLTAAQLKELYVFCEDYRQFLSASKTERLFVKNGIEAAEKAGFKDYRTVKSVKPGDRLYANNRGKNLCLFVIGKKPLSEGMNVVGAHIDSPRIEKYDPVNTWLDQLPHWDGQDRIAALAKRVPTNQPIGRSTSTRGSSGWWPTGRARSR